MPGKRRYGTVGKAPGNPGIVVQSGIGITDSAATITRLRKLFQPPPWPDSASTSEYDDAAMRQVAEAVLYADNVAGDPTLWPDGVDQTYSKAPNIPADVPIGGGGLPSTAYTPNASSPGADPSGAVNVDPSGQADLGMAVDGSDFLPTGGQTGVDGLKNPATEAASISNANKTGTNLALGGHGDEPSIKFDTK